MPLSVVWTPSSRARARPSEVDSIPTSQVSSGLEPEDVHEPGRAWVPLHHHDAERGKAAGAKQHPRHWKMKMWKRRTTVRKAKALTTRTIAEQA